ncbi:MAG: UbiA family prenyltransferase [Gemmataceae bacterium]
MSRLRPYLQLVRFPAVFTALADILLGALALGVRGSQWLTVVLLALTSACLYLSGMVWNDFFDLEQDKRERPSRPIPSGRMTRRAAGRLGTGLMTAGLALALAAGWTISYPNPDEADSFSWMPAKLAGYLVCAIFLYNGFLKQTWAGPVAMGACRFVNVLLGLSALGPALPAWSLRMELPVWGFHLAGIIGLYIIGVTWFASREAVKSNKAGLIGASAVMLASALLALALPARLAPGTSSPLFPYLLVVLLFLVGFPVYRAIANPSPTLVQAAVKRCLLGLVVFDAVLATIWAGWLGLLILLLLVPIHFLNRWRWLYMT